LQILHIAKADRPITFYSLDVIISVGKSEGLNMNNPQSLRFIGGYSYSILRITGIGVTSIFLLFLLQCENCFFSYEYFSKL